MAGVEEDVQVLLLNDLMVMMIYARMNWTRLCIVSVYKVYHIS